jgi:hypothetical protein
MSRLRILWLALFRPAAIRGIVDAARTWAWTMEADEYGCICEPGDPCPRCRCRAALDELGEWDWETDGPRTWVDRGWKITPMRARRGWWI